VGRRLVEHCEEYLRAALLEKASIEYFCIAGHASSERLRQWYEARLGYTCFKAKETGQSYRGNEVNGSVFFRHASKSLDVSAGRRDETNSSKDEQIAARKRHIAQFLLKGKKRE
jgi:hypothetical protein